MRLRLLPIALLCTGVLALSPAARADEGPPAEVLAQVDAMLAGTESLDAAKFGAAFSVEPTIVDEFPPFQWQGVDAAKRFVHDLQALVSSASMTDIKAVRRPATYFHRDGRLAYLTVPVDFSFRIKGSPVTERGAYVISLYELEGTGWKIRTSAWYLINNSVEPPLGAGLK